MHYLQRILPLFFVGSLLTSCSEEVQEPLTIATFVETTTDELTFNVEAPNDAVLRSTTETSDPLTNVKSLRFVFYRSFEQTHRVAYIREISAVTNNLSDISIKIPKGDYKLVVIANPTAKLIELTRENNTLDKLTTGQPQTAENLKIKSNTVPNLLIPMLNTQGPISITVNSFENSATIPIQIEPSLARVLVFGSPEVLRGRQGTAPIRYTITNVTKEMSYLRMLNKLEGGGNESLGDNSSRASRYASCKLWSSWEEQTPTNTNDVAQLTANLYNKQEYWTTATTTVEDFATQLSTPTLYCKEGVVPPNAYLQGLVPTAVIAFPYIPEELTLSNEEGWVEYQGRVYPETRVKTMIQTRKYDTPELEGAIRRGNITQNSFSEGFSKENINFYHKGINYYGIPIRHFASATNPTDYGRYGVVRGNEYRIKLVRVTQMGSPTPMLYQNNLTPVEESLSLSHSLMVTPIEKREQEIEL